MLSGYFFAEEPLLFAAGLIAPLGIFIGGPTVAAGRPPVYPPRFWRLDDPDTVFSATVGVLLSVDGLLDDLLPADLACGYVNKVTEAPVAESAVGGELPRLLQQEIGVVGYPPAYELSANKPAIQVPSIARARMQTVGLSENRSPHGARLAFARART
jgi:hypothetical protein